MKYSANSVWENKDAYDIVRDMPAAKLPLPAQDSV